jgi:transposase InsO family protein
LKSFLGILNTFKDNIEHCGEKQKSLNMLCGGYSRKTAGHKVKWNPEADAAFEVLKEAIKSMPTLHLKGKSDEYSFVLRTDASDYGCGAHLVQKRKLGFKDDGKESLGEDETLMFVSKAFDKTQINWCTAEKECYAVWYACQKLEYLLEGETFVIEVDHKNLTILEDSANQKVQRWKAYLRRFDASWRYIKGSTNVIADAMSRIVDIDEKQEKNIELFEENDIIAAMSELILSDECHGDSRLESGQSLRVLAEKQDGTYRHYQAESTQVDSIQAVTETTAVKTSNKKLNFEERQYIIDIIKKVHNATSGHLGASRTADLVDRYLTELTTAGEIPPRINLNRLSKARRLEIIKTFIDRCDICQKASSKGEKIAITPFTVSTYGPHECVQADHIGPFPEDRVSGAKYILVIIDTFTRWVELYPVKEATADDSAEAISDYVMRYSAPHTIMTDRGSAFLGYSFEVAARGLNIEKKHPKFAGDKEALAIVERANAEVRHHINNLAYELSKQLNWAANIRIVQRILNNSVHSSTGFAPAHLMYGKLNTGPLEAFKKFEGTGVVSTPAWLEQKLDAQETIMRYIRTRLQENDTINLSKREVNDQYVLKVTEYVLYKRMDKKKHQTTWVGPYLVTEKNGDWYELTSVKQDEKSFFAHARQLKRFHVNDEITPLEIAYRDDMGIIDEVVAHDTPYKNSSTKRNVTVGCTYAGFPKDIHWFPLQKVENTEPFVRYCLAHGYNAWITPQAHHKYAQMIKQHNDDIQRALQLDATI